MPLKHIRICVHCDQIRWAPCSNVCRVPHDEDPQSWHRNIQDGAGEMLRQETRDTAR